MSPVRKVESCDRPGLMAWRCPAPFRRHLRIADGFPSKFTPIGQTDLSACEFKHRSRMNGHGHPPRPESPADTLKGSKATVLVEKNRAGLDDGPHRSFVVLLPVLLIVSPIHCLCAIARSWPSLRASEFIRHTGGASASECLPSHFQSSRAPSVKSFAVNEDRLTHDKYRAGPRWTSISNAW
jgi:hypothetical protein